MSNAEMKALAGFLSGLAASLEARSCAALEVKP
jgi:hypothetical protein